MVLGDEGLDAHRIAEVIVSCGGRQRRGSAYRVATASVLTAAHVVTGATDITVRFDAGLPGEWAVPATVAWRGTEHDIALLTIQLPAGAAPVPPAGYGTVGGDRHAVLSVHAAGFPRWKQRRRPTGTVYRELHGADGTVSVLSNRRGGMLELTVTPPAEDPDPQVSPWEAMSGAVVWAGARIIGVVAEHHRREGLGRLTAARIDRCLTDTVELRELLGVADPDALPDVVAPSAAWLARSGYVDLVHDIAPVGGLRDRRDELAELAAFCSGDEAYVWWQAGPWAGKSALMSIFVLNPPPAVDIVSFFVTARLASQGDSAAFTEALLDQLAALTGEALPPLLTPLSRDSHRRALMRTAAAQAAGAGRRLVLVVDGLDEDRGTTPGSGMASIASLLPKEPGSELRIIVSGRPSPPIPDDVPHDHPLRHCRIRPLDVSPHAREIAARARSELSGLLAGDHVHRDVLGLITACGGGLSIDELAELTGRPKPDLDGLLAGVFGRTVAGRLDSSSTDPHRVFLFAHETLRVEAIERLGASLLEHYRARVHEWADKYRRLGWPTGTPRYLLRGYARMLQAERDLDRLVTCATDRRRHDRMLDVTGGDANAFAEVRITQEMLLASAEPDITVMTMLAVRRDQLAMRNKHIPVELPAFWARLGYPARAESLVRGLAGPARQARAMIELLLVWAGTIEAGRAAVLVPATESVVGSIPSPSDRAATAVDLADAVAVTGDHERAAAIAAGVGESHLRFQAQARVAQRAARHGRFDFAVRLVRKIQDPYWAAKACADITVALVDVGENHRAAALARGIEQPYWRAMALVGIVRVGSGDGRVSLGEAQGAAADVADPHLRSQVTTALVRAQVTAAAPETAAALIGAAENLANGNANLYGQGRALAELAQAASAAGYHQRALAIATSIPSPSHRMDALAALAMRAASVAEYDHAETVVSHLGGAEAQAHVLAKLAHTTVDVAPERARRWADTAAGALREVVSAGDRLQILILLVRIAAMLRSSTRLEAWSAHAEAEVRVAAPVDRRPTALAEVAACLAAAGDTAAAYRLFSEAAATTADIVRRAERHPVSLQIATAMADTHQYEGARSVVRAIAEPVREAEAFTVLAEHARVRGDSDLAIEFGTMAEDIARRIVTHHEQARALIDVARALVDGDARRARQVAAAAEPHARAVAEGRDRDKALADLAIVMAAVGEVDRAETIATDVSDVVLAPTVWAHIARAAAAVGDAKRADTIARTIRGPAQDQALEWVVVELAGVAVRNARAGRPPSTALLTEAEAIARSIYEPSRRVLAFAKIVVAAAELADFSRATRLATAAGQAAESVADAVDRMRAWAALSQPLQDLVRLAAATGDLLAGEAVAIGITDRGIRAQALTILAQKALETDRGHARRLADVARAAAGEIDERNLRDERLATLAPVAAAAGADESALSIADAIDTPYFKQLALTDIARTLAGAGDYDAAAAVVGLIPGHLHRANAFIELATAAVTAGRYHEARTLGAEATLAADAIPPADRYSDLPEVAGNLTELARRLAFAGQADPEGPMFAGIEALARTIDTPRRSSMLERLATAAALSGDHRRAYELREEAAADIPAPLRPPAYEPQPPDPRWWAPGALTAAINHEQAERGARALADPEERAEALASLATELLDAGDREQAHRLAVEALSVGRWTTALSVAYRLNPSVLEVVADSHAGVTGG